MAVGYRITDPSSAARSHATMLPSGAHSRPSRLHMLPIAALVGALEAHEAAAMAFTHEANTPRSGEHRAAAQYLDDVADIHHNAMEEIIAELELRLPKTPWEQSARATALVKWHVGHDNLHLAKRYLMQACE